MPEVDRLLLVLGFTHALVGLVCLGLLALRQPSILGIHPAQKPLKFAFSISLFLTSMAVLLPSLSASDPLRRGLSVALALSMATEMAVIGVQALRGRRSHFNFEKPVDWVLTSSMMLGILVLLAVMIAIAFIATIRPLAAPSLIAAAWRSGLWLFLFASVSGFGMGARAGHSVGGNDGGQGLLVTNWSTTHGDLRVSHFFALHALQILPLIAFALSLIPIGSGARWTLLVLAILGNAVLAGWTWLQALASRPAWPRAESGEPEPGPKQR